MKLALSDVLVSHPDLSRLVQGVRAQVEETFSNVPGTSAIWDLKPDPEQRPRLVLSVRDLGGSAKTVFAPDELKNTAELSDRLHTLRDELAGGHRRSLIGIRDQVVSLEQLERLRHALNTISDIGRARLKMDNRVSMGGSGILLTNFTIEVDETFVAAVKQAISEAGFTARDAPLVSRPSVLKTLRTLAAAHANDPALAPEQIVWFQLDDPKDAHLLEISGQAFDPGDGSLQGIALAAGESVPGVRSIVVYVAPPSELHKAFEVNPNHPAVRALLDRQFVTLYPDDSGASLLEEFPEMAGAPV